MNARKKPRATGGSEAESSPQGRLQSLLELSLGDTLVAQVAVAHALSLAGRTALPESGPELLAFVRAHLVSILTGELGPRLTIALLDDLADKLDPGAVDLSNELPRSSQPAPAKTPPFSGPREKLEVLEVPATPSSRAIAARIDLLLIDPDRVGRTALARALVRAGSNVTVVDTASELDAALEGGDTFDAALVDAYHPAAHVIVSALVRRVPRVVVVARSREATTTRELLTRLGVTRFEVRLHDAPPEELVDAIRRTLGTS